MNAQEEKEILSSLEEASATKREEQLAALEEVSIEEDKETRGEYSDATYTISFINGSPGLVIRADHSNEMLNRITKILPVFKKFKDSVETAKPPQPSNLPKPASSVTFTPDDVTSICQTHKVSMKEGQSKKKFHPDGTPKRYFYHRSAEGQMCFGRGYQD